MKLIYFSILSALIITTSCKSSFFYSANNMRNIYGTAFTINGDTLSGEITVDVNGGNNYLRIKPSGGKERKISLTEIKEIIIRNEFYLPKKLDQAGIGWNENRLFLMKRLTKAESKIQLYEFIDGFKEYYISLQNMKINEAYNIEQKNITPNFETKVSEMVKDCLPLSDKIKNKEKGYFYAQMSFNEENKINTWFRIIDEYNICH